MKGSSARALDITTLNLTKTQWDRVVGDQCRRRTGKTKSVLRQEREGPLLQNRLVAIFAF